MSDPSEEWLETDGLGGFAMGQVDLAARRRYHAFLVTATNPPTGRFALVNGLAVSLRGQDVFRFDRESFRPEPWPTWTFRVPGGGRITFEIAMISGESVTLVRFRLDGVDGPLEIRPLLTGRDHHQVHWKNDHFRFDAEVDGPHVTWRPYEGVPAIACLFNGVHSSERWWWWRHYDLDEERGYPADEDCAVPACLRFDGPEAVLAFSTKSWGSGDPEEDIPAAFAAEHRRRRVFPDPLARAADQFLVRRGNGLSIVAGYPWFTDWGRDTFIAMRGLLLATGRLDEARDVLRAWAATVSEGMVPNRFTDHGEDPEFNSVDASLWFVVTAGEFLRRTGRDDVIENAISHILEGYSRGTRYGIRMDDDGLITAAADGLQLTWMDAKVGDWVVTPRRGKPVEVQALWFNALKAGEALDAKWGRVAERVRETFETRYWNESIHYLVDVIDEQGAPDARLRPNQLFAVGGLPNALISGDRARHVVEHCERHLWTPRGLRTLSPLDPDYRGHYAGDVHARDAAYHQGTVWPWLLGPFVEAWVRVNGNDAAAKAEARGRFLSPLLASMGITGHVPELADGAPPHFAKGAPFQAWSLGELIRLEREVLI